jgi:hypothetical protein
LASATRIACSASIATVLFSSCGSAPHPPATETPATIASTNVENGRTRLVLQIGNTSGSLTLERDATVAPDAPPIRVEIVANVPRSALVAMDTYPSRAGGLSYCQAGEESFLRVITTATGTPMESYETKVASCRDNLELADPGVEWDARTTTVLVHWLRGPGGAEETRRLVIRSDGRTEIASGK